MEKETNTSFRELFAEAEKHDDYWLAGAVIDFAEELARRMEETKVSRSQLAARLGTSPAYITKILEGSTNLTLATMVRLGRALNTEVRFRLVPRGTTTPPYLTPDNPSF